LKAKKKKTDILWTIYETAQIGILTKQWDALRVPGLLFVMAGPFVSQTAWKEYGDSLHGVLVQLTETGGMPLKKYPKSTEFYEKCIKKWPDWQYSYGHSPGNSYDSVYLFVNAIERAGTLDVGPLVKTIEETDRQGVTGRVKFDKHHKIIYGEDPQESAIMVFFQWQNGKAVPVSPTPIAEGKIIIPSRMKK
ncbi:MAG: ABC transporter substrate-binding protein, partial [Thermodesulfobacteriota bacterium]|nr:ABC transporter substrate-binding protein [Thermodesulfobacteriota bacterium]